MKTKELELNNRKYIITKWDAISAFKLQVKVTKLLGSALGGIDKLNNKDIQNFMKMDVAKLVSSVGSVLEKVDEDKFIELVLQLLSKNIKTVKYADDKEVEVPLLVDSLEIMEMYELAFSVLELNLGKLVGDVKLKFNAMSDSKKKGN